MSNNKTGAVYATVIGVQESLILVEFDESVEVMKNEVGYVYVGEERLKAEILRVRGRTADMQVFDDTRGVRVGDRVELSGEMLSATLGPGLLGQVFDGLLNPLHGLAEKYGFTEVSLENLYINGLIGRTDKVKVLANGELKAKLSFKVNAASEKAKSAIEAAGGSLEIVKSFYRNLPGASSVSSSWSGVSET